jgi:hypothetical protein
VPEASPAPEPHETDPRLIDLLNVAGGEWGPLGVALAAAQLTSRRALIIELAPELAEANRTIRRLEADLATLRNGANAAQRVALLRFAAKLEHVAALGGYLRTCNHIAVGELREAAKAARGAADAIPGVDEPGPGDLAWITQADVEGIFRDLGWSESASSSAVDPLWRKLNELLRAVQPESPGGGRPLIPRDFSLRANLLVLAAKWEHESGSWPGGTGSAASKEHAAAVRELAARRPASVPGDASESQAVQPVTEGERPGSVDLSAAGDGLTLGEFLEAVRIVDAHLDSAVGVAYEDEPLAHRWARVTKVCEEAGEVWRALSKLTGENPRKGVCGTEGDLLGELGDTASAAICAIQHLTKDPARTWAVVSAALIKARARVAEFAGERA